MNVQTYVAHLQWKQVTPNKKLTNVCCCDYFFGLPPNELEISFYRMRSHFNLELAGRDEANKFLEYQEIH